ncbi:hypothetical protein JCM10296v2_001749 [Rhodotorula toruloides]
MFAAAALAASLAASAFAAPLPVALRTVEAALSLPNTTQTNTAYYYYQNGRAGACGWYSKDSDLVVGLPREFYSDLASVSPYCGQFVVVEGKDNKTITALVADASTLNETMTLSIGSWDALNGNDGLKTVQWRFANATESSAAKKALESGSPAPAPSSTSTYVAPSSSSPAAKAEVKTTSAAPEKPSTTSSWEAPKSSSTSYAPKPSSTSTWEEKKTSTTTWAPKPTTTSEWKPTTTTTTWTPPKTTTTWEAPATTQAKTYSSASSGQYSGQATFFFQNGVAGACGSVHSDSDYIVAMDSRMYAGGSHCGQTVHITNTNNGKTVTATVADECPTCSSSGSLDLSQGAFNAIGSESDGVEPITWSFGGSARERRS